MKRYLCSLVLTAACAGLGSCSKATDPAGGSQTHFVDCTKQSQCTALGPDFSCVDGRCRAGQMAADAGSGGESGQSGGAGTAGSGSGAAGVSVGIEAGRSGAGAGSGTGGAAGGTAGAAGASSGTRCDGSDAVWLWAGSEGGGLLEWSFDITNPHGHSYLLIDGHCRYYVFREVMVGTKTGTLTEDEAQRIASDLRYDSLPAWAGRGDAPCPDAGAQFLARAEARVYCSCGCDPNAPAGLTEAMRASGEWSAMLGERGMAMDGPVAAIAALQMMPTTVNPPIDWPLSRRITAIPDFLQEPNTLKAPVHFEGEEAALLRALRTQARATPQWFNYAFVEDGAATYDVFMHDVLPEAVTTSMMRFPRE